MLPVTTDNWTRWLAAIFAAALVLAVVVTGNHDSAEAIDPDDANTAYIADGNNFPDALVGATIATLNNAPMLGVAGTQSGDVIPQETIDELDRLTDDKANPLDTIYVLGGPAAVSDSVVSQLGDWATDVQRIFGANRFGTFEAISQMLPAKIGEAENAENAADSDLLDGFDANSLVRVASDSTDSEALVDSSGDAASTTITAPTSGALVISASSDVYVEDSTTNTAVTCRIEVDDTEIASSDRTIQLQLNTSTAEYNGEENCATDAYVPVAAGDHTVDFEYSSVAPYVVDETVLNVMFVPFGPDGVQITP